LYITTSLIIFLHYLLRVLGIDMNPIDERSTDIHCYTYGALVPARNLAASMTGHHRFRSCGKGTGLRDRRRMEGG
jgi:hypothetical protein